MLAQAYLDLQNKQRKEIEDFPIAYETFVYEMDNHEYAINWDGDYDVLCSLGMDKDNLEKMGLQCIYETARREHM